MVVHQHPRQTVERGVPVGPFQPRHGPDALAPTARGPDLSVTPLGREATPLTLPAVAGTIDLRALVARMANRSVVRTEANVQSDLHTLLTAAPLNLSADDLESITLELPAGQRRRIDVEVGFTVFEVKRDLRVGNVRVDAVEQLAGYVRQRTEAMNQRYVGVLTDGAEWHLYHLVGSVLSLVSSLQVDPSDADVDGLAVWLEAVLATVDRITPNPREIARRLGAESPSHALDAAELVT